MIKGEFFALVSDSGQMRLFSGCSDAARELCVSRQYIQQCMKAEKSCKGMTVKGYVKRFFMVKTKDGRFRICIRKEDAWIVVGSDKEVIRDEQMESWVDISEVCYNGRKHNRV